MRIVSAYSFIFVALQIFSTAALADWSAPIQCAVKTVIGESGPKVEALSGMTEGRLIKKIESVSVNRDGEYVKEAFNYEIYVRLMDTNIYMLHMKDIDQNSTVSAQIIVPNGNTVEKEMMLIKDYPIVNGLAPLFPRFKILLKCQLRSQASPGIPDLTPGPPSAM